MLQLRTYLSLKEINDVLLYLAQRKFSKKLFIVIEFIEAIIYIITWLFRVIMEHYHGPRTILSAFLSHTPSHTLQTPLSIIFSPVSQVRKLRNMEVK